MSATSEAAVEELATFLYARDWPSDVRTNVQRKYEYRCLAAAIVNGEAWAIRKAWPEAAREIQTRSDWGSK